jgi:hypothetical protein
MLTGSSKLTLDIPRDRWGNETGGGKSIKADLSPQNSPVPMVLPF